MSGTRSWATAAVRAGLEADRQHGAVIPPLHLAANFTFEGVGARRTYDYTRSGNPTRDLVGAAIAELEEGAGAVVTASGMAAIHLVLQLVPQGGLVIAPHDGYGGTHRLLAALHARGSLRVRFVDFGDPDALAEALQARPFLVWIETPSNPLLRVVDIAATAGLARAAGALVAVDNTFLSPALQNPLRLGADVVVHSTTKYLNGHSDVVGGAVVARDAAVLDTLSWWLNALGAAGAPFDAYLTLRGLRTLAVRMRAHEANAAAIAAALARDPRVRRVHYPGLPEHPGHAIAARQQRGFGGMLSFELPEGPGAVRAFVEGLGCFSLAESLGGVESLVAHPATMTHACMDARARAEAGISDSLLRLSVGIEACDDLLLDLEKALDRVSRVVCSQSSRTGSQEGSGSKRSMA
ncbi:MAG TPA: cystathionine gamma-synthase [Candidatus Polarisedimenticolaceae bacterium]|nr:cystathionine gamma-synthase [Candidatus Polarisedimenticolaceae bacterium]